MILGVVTDKNNVQHNNDNRHDVANKGKPSLNKLNMGIRIGCAIDLVREEKVVLTFKVDELSSHVEDVERRSTVFNGNI